MYVFQAPGTSSADAADVCDEMPRHGVEGKILEQATMDFPMAAESSLSSKLSRYHRWRDVHLSGLM